MSKSFIENAPERVDNANQIICTFIESIKSSADLHVKLTDNGRSNVSGLGNRFYAKGIEEFFLEKRVPIPPELFQEMDHMRSHLTMGLFPEVKRAYVTIDCDVYLWSYDADADLAVFDGVPNTILKLCLSKPRPGVFQPHITHVLVVGTVSDIILFGITNGAEEGLSVIPDPLFKVDLDGQMLRTIVSTDNGRIFFTAKDVLYEFEYQEKGWLGRSCKKVDKSTTLFDSIASYIKPVVDGIEEVVIDSTRNILYTLTTKSSIQVFDLGVKGEECVKAVTLSIGQIMHEATSMTQGQHEASFFSSIVALSAIPSTQSYKVNLVAVSSKGVRIYFSCMPKQQPRQQQQAYLNEMSPTQLMSMEECRPRCLRMLHVRLSPGICPSSLYSEAPQGVYAAQVDSTLSVMTTTGRDVVFALSNLYHPQQDVETMNELKMDGHVWAMSWERKRKLSSGVIPSGFIPALIPHPFYTQHYTNDEQLLLFTNNALYVFVHRSPLDTFRAALSEKGHGEGESIMELCKSLGSINALVMAVSILSSEASSDISLKDKAARLIFGWKDEAEIVDTHTMRLVSPGETSLVEWQTKLKSPLHSSTPHVDVGMGAFSAFSPSSPLDRSSVHGKDGPFQFKASTRHDALYSYFSRLVYPLWHSPLAMMKADGQMIPSLPCVEMEWMALELVKLGRAMDEFTLVPKMINPLVRTGDTSIHAQFQSEAATRERQSLFGLRLLVTQTSETLYLWAIAVNQGLHQVTVNMEEESKGEMTHRRLSELATNPALNSMVIKTLIEFFLGDDGGTKELSERLRRLCSNLYSKEDALVTAALELLERVLASPSNGSSSRLLEEAVRLLKESVSKLDLEQVAEKLIKLRAFESVVDLSLLRAAKDDPLQLAINVYRNGGKMDAESMDVVNKRAAAYGVITKMMDDLRSPSISVTANQRNVESDQIMTAVLSTDDEMAHAALFRWLMNRGQKDKILNSKSPFLEQWLSIEIGRGGGVKYLDVMWRYYEKNGLAGKAAKLLNRLTDSELAEISLTDRLSYLSHAIICAQSTSDNESRTLIQELRDKLEVAQIQMAIKEALEDRGQEESFIARQLNGKVLGLQDLCLKYAVPFKLAKLQLEIFKCANFYDEEKIHNVWRQLLDREFESCSDAGGSIILGTIADLNCKFGDSNYFPTELIVMHVVERCFEYGIDPVFFISLLSKMNISLAVFLTFLSDHYRNGDPFWRENVNAHDYIVIVAVNVVEDFISNSRKYTDPQRMALTSKCEVALSRFAVDSRSISSHSSSSVRVRLERVSAVLANMN
ncbi:hypothetical protein PFISCL1PPCAC_15635 [Pristionchus fissidentatus]|uniref:Uncharacterized protein n=1 Tax=Pristionchus fissidentatus TaxID=1538716 RepID=A0AAV5W0X3_9BILA|nr:hypothetical protein PFISCL1PPCAC_15635 [Pristionchus fissidentatus]